MVEEAFIRGGTFITDNMVITSFHWHHLNKNTPHENKYFNAKHQKHCISCLTGSHNMWYTSEFKTQLLQVIAELLAAMYHLQLVGQNLQISC